MPCGEITIITFISEKWINDYLMGILHHLLTTPSFHSYNMDCLMFLQFIYFWFETSEHIA